MAKFGCTAPFGYDINNICTNQNQSKHALELYRSLFYKRFTIKECPYPCTFMKVSFRSKTPINSPGLTLKFNKFIRTTRATHFYGELEMLAEFGGYVGLFLGISVYHLRTTFDKVLGLILQQQVQQ